MSAEVSSIEGERVRARVHPKCVVCSPLNGSGLKLHFSRQGDNGVEAEFHCHDILQGYSGYLHGGVVTTLMDGAMANCMFERGLAVVTAELNVRFLHPVCTDSPATVRAWVEKSSPLMHLLRAEVLQGDEVKATAEGKFMNPSWKEDAVSSQPTVG